ncbi:MAG: hypothetical protein EA350_13830 [Gemmatimonadales bacterium]|nr:MAG: hypothetical protein EA350_13830 [Gemmatimonadales bacterium]
MNVVEVPPSLDYRTLDRLFQLAGTAVEGKTLLDARHLRWVDPVGMIGLLGIGRVIRDRTGEPAILHLPESGDVPGYMARMGFFAQAEGIFASIRGATPRRGARPSDVLLEITPISENRHIHELVERVQGRAGAILSRTLRYPPSAVVHFSVILSEVCGNILEHAEAPGWVAAQTYHWSKRLGRQVLVVAVGDLGRGFRGSLTPEYAGRYGDRWGDATALEAAFIHGLTRFPDQGRGQGIQQMRKQVRRWDGVMAVRSGTARIADVPDWEDLPPLEEGLAPFPGAWITLLLPAAVPEPEGGR